MISSENERTGRDDDNFNLDDPDSLPWLESDGDYRDESASAGRVATMLLGGLALLALVVGAIFWLQKQASGPERGNGEMIAAQEGDYKVKPADPEGKKFEGDGDTAFAASEGRKAGMAGAKQGAPVKAGGVTLVQLGAFSNNLQAEQGWAQLAEKLKPLQGVERRITSAMVDGRKVFRLNAVVADPAAGNRLCSALKAAGANCLVVR